MKSDVTEKYQKLFPELSYLARHMIRDLDPQVRLQIFTCCWNPVLYYKRRLCILLKTYKYSCLCLLDTICVLERSWILSHSVQGTRNHDCCMWVHSITLLLSLYSRFHIPPNCRARSHNGNARIELSVLNLYKTKLKSGQHTSIGPTTPSNVKQCQDCTYSSLICTSLNAIMVLCNEIKLSVKVKAQSSFFCIICAMLSIH